MIGPVKLLLVFVDETDLWEDQPLYSAIVQRLHQLGAAGATVHMGVMGFGSHHRLHQKRLFGISDDRPVMIVVADEERKLREVLPKIRPMVSEGLILLLNAEVPD
jgi:PII-like signaling protein